MPSMLGEVAAPRIDMTQLPPEAAALIAHLQQQVHSQAREIAWRDAKLEKVNLELARLKRASEVSFLARPRIHSDGQELTVATGSFQAYRYSPTCFHGCCGPRFLGRVVFEGACQ